MDHRFPDVLEKDGKGNRMRSNMQAQPEEVDLGCADVVSVLYSRGRRTMSTDPFPQGFAAYATQILCSRRLSG